MILFCSFFIIDIEFWSETMFEVGFFFVFPSKLITNNFHWPSGIALFYSIGCLLNDMYVFESFLSLHRLVNNVDDQLSQQCG